MKEQIEEKSPDLVEPTRRTFLIELHGSILDQLNMMSAPPAPALIFDKLEELDKLVSSMVIMNKIDIDSTVESEYKKCEGRISHQFVRANQYGSSQHKKALEKCKKEIKQVHDHYHAMSDSIMAFKSLLKDIDEGLLSLCARDVTLYEIAMQTLETIQAIEPRNEDVKTSTVLEMGLEVVNDPLDLGNLSLATNAEEVPVDVLGGSQDADVTIHTS